MKLLELFSGTHSVGKVAKQNGWVLKFFILQFLKPLVIHFRIVSRHVNV
jgi:hypothetical protein